MLVSLFEFCTEKVLTPSGTQFTTYPCTLLQTPLFLPTSLRSHEYAKGKALSKAAVEGSLR